MDLRGFLVRCHRLQRNYSQEGLCRGICAVSYLSKLEQGKVQAADEIYQALFHRLGIVFQVPFTCTISLKFACFSP